MGKKTRKICKKATDWSFEHSEYTVHPTRKGKTARKGRSREGGELKLEGG